MTPKIHLLLLAALVLGAGGASAQDTEAFVRRPLVMLRATGALPSSLQRLIAALSKPKEVPIAPGERPEAVMRTFCGGSVTQEYIDRAVAANGIELKPSAQLRTVSLPACANTAVREFVTVASTDVAASLTRQAFGVAPEVPVTLCEGQPPREFSSCTLPAIEAIRQFNRGGASWVDTLKPGQEVQVPRRTRYTSFELKDGIEAADAIARIQVAAERVTAETGATPVASVQAGGGFQLLSLLGADDARVRGSPCEPKAGDPPAAWPYDIDELKAALELSLREAARRGVEVRPAVVRVADTGALGLGDFFPEQALAMNRRVAPGMRQLDGNGRYGVDAASIGDVTPEAGDPNRLHGTQVADYALGTLPLRRSFNRIYDLVRVTFFKVFQQDRGAYVVSDTTLLRSMQRNKFYDDAAVVNFSVGGDRKHTEAFRTELLLEARTSNFLAVVAAGNKGDDLASSELYPASYGGDPQVNPYLLVVGASAPAGAPAQYSNYSRHVVDLVAPGCRLPFTSPDGQPMLLTGTSLAAPQVSFAAALVRALGVTDMADVKARLMAAADYDPALEDRARHSSALNVARSVLVFHDVVRPRASAGDSAAGRDVPGRWQRDASFAVCADAVVLPSSLLSVTPVQTAQGWRLRVLHRLPGGALATRDCQPSSSEVVLLDEAGQRRPFSWPAIATFVPAQRDLLPP